MSKTGIQVAADIFTQMQIARHTLHKMGTEKNLAKTTIGQQDILLARMFEKANDAIKSDFNKITMMEIS